MQIPDEPAWEPLKKYVSTDQNYAPTRAMLAVAALVDPNEIRGAVTTFDRSGPSIWTTTFATTTAIGRVVASFDAEYYDLGEERSPQFRNNAPAMELTEAWIRPFSSVRQMGIGNVTAPFARENWYQVNGMTLTFDDGETLTLPSQDRLYGGEVEREFSDGLLAAVRRGVSF